MNRTITLTGIDEKTNLNEVVKLDCELGILYSSTPNKRNRYPSFEWIKTAVQKLPKVALHVCGNKARAELLSGKLTGILSCCRRLQVNGILDWREVNKICSNHYYLQVITQHNDKNQELVNQVIQPNHQILVDASGGNGISPESWNRPVTDKTVGFAGGLGPDNLINQLEIIRGLATGNDYWVDMESKLRTNDYFDIDIASKCIEMFTADCLKNKYINNGFQ